MKGTHFNKILQNNSSKYYIKDYDAIKKLYTLENPITKDVKTITKYDFDTLYSGHRHKF